MNWTPPEIGHDVHIDDVVSMALGLGPLDPQDYLFALFHEKLDEVHNRATQARKDPSLLSGISEQVDIEALDSAVKEWDEEYARAVNIYNALQTEVDGAMRGRNGDIDVTNDPKVPSDARMTKQSAYKWLKAVFDIEVPEWAPPQPASSATNKGMRESEREKFQITLAVLTKLYVEARGRKFGTRETPNVGAVAEALAQAIELEGAYRPGLSAKTTGDRLSDALKVLDRSK